MLVLSVKQDERLFIGESIEILLVEGEGQVKLGVTAPRHVRIDRESVRRSRLTEGDRSPLPGAMPPRRPKPAATSELLWPPPAGEAGWEN